MANWRSYSRTEHFFGLKSAIFGVLPLRNKERLSKGFDVKWHVPSTCLDASRMWFSIGIYSINRTSELLWLKLQQTPQNGQNVHGFPVRTPICHIVPVSRAYGGGGLRPPQPPHFLGFGIFSDISVQKTPRSYHFFPSKSVLLVT